ncbi:glycine--tRNA ligase [Leptospira borgpetersenii]|uniref:glycine--tRNA ligase n=1 Tax=Leptospira borgpetersenii TaxID=174 RepID=UPI000774587F|nr:glycine--tRNA ligase [Leptospira borgpetersenii]MBE8365236.1 glycine--tRNA ligase [Leptospira borgpetersenii serovar Balcanica]MBE8367216.1 glycine--tRNA ligase [Leptospira borgpetersenii serovar Balcanica]MBE8401170.1 glycine--tRNA ligase [Leptospira borgpetersenii serovar Tarassovi]MBE8403366.1 glycine--tRNA ligase [Leptospira borgpetersenii serovar Tarassovi]MBE8405383.1 glycine--tRNA ligase [Leptospira borgpetersenii serovar Tarassovi]
MEKKESLDSSLKEIVSVCKRRGFVYPGSEIYGGLSNTFDYGPYGVELLQNLKQLWWKFFVHLREDVVGLDSSILLNPKVWEASGHVSNFTDPLIDCKNCKTRIRADKFLEDQKGEGFATGLTLEKMNQVIKENNFSCPNCGQRGTFTEARDFNLMFKTSHGASAEDSLDIYLRPETAQGIFLNFKNVVSTTRRKIPFGIAQIGKSFRNEIMARQFVFRTREFEQMEMEFFCEPGTQKEWFSHWVNYCMNWLTEQVGVKKENLRIREHEKEELSFYSEGTSDIEFKYNFGWGELWGIASRTDYDLNQHQKFSGEDLKYQDQVQNKKYVPFVVEPALGVNRLFLAVVTDAYQEEKLPDGEIRTVLRFSPKIAPVKAAVFPLMKKDGLPEKSREIFADLSKLGNIEYDDSGAIGKRYRRQDEIGTPFCITVDYDTLKDDTVTVRERDSMAQERISVTRLRNWLFERL